MEGTVATEIAPELRDNFSTADEFFAYADLRDLESCVTALDQLEGYIAAEGPFDGVLAFSQGAALAVVYLAQKWAQDPAAERLSSTFKCAILFSSRDAYNATLRRLEALGLSQVPEFLGRDGGLINIPSAHIWGRNDPDVDGEQNLSLFSAKGREEYIHEGGHEIPSVRMNAAIKSSVRVIRRAVASSEQSAKG